MTLSNDSDTRRSVIGLLAALPLSAILIGAMYSAVGLIG